MTQQCVNCPGAEDHSTAQCPVMAEASAVVNQQVTAADSLPVGVPDGYMPIPTAEQIADALDGVRCYHDMSAELIAPRLLANLLASTTVKAEQAPTPEFVWVRLLEALAGDNGCPFTASTDDYREAKPALVQLIAAGLFRDDADSLDGDIWTIAAGEQSEAAARFASCADAYAVLSDVLNRVFERPDEAPSLPAAGSADQQYPDGIADDLERSDWTPIEALQWYAAGKHFDVADGRTRIIDTGAVASNALKHASLAYLELKGDAELSELRAVLSAQQSAQQSASPEFCCELSYKAAKQKAWDARLIERCKCDHNEHCDHCWPADFRPGGKWHGKFVAQQSAHVSVPRELLADLVSQDHDTRVQAERRLYALLNGGEA